jgi:hypothetical protein
MWFETDAGNRLWLVQQRRLERIHDAEWERLVRLDKRDSAAGCMDQGYGLRSRVGGILVTAGRVLDPRLAPCDDPCSDGA